jgi:hypothetical protein
MEIWKVGIVIGVTLLVVVWCLLFQWLGNKKINKKLDELVKNNK